MTDMTDMTDRRLVLHELPPSPNNVKVRLALKYKKLPYESRPLPRDASKPGLGFDRTELIRATGQPLTPALLHGDTVVYDSAAILRYLDGNFRGTPRLFSEDYETMRSIEDWERHGKLRVGEPVSMAFGQCFAPSADAAVLDRASGLMHDATARCEERLDKGRWLVGDAPTAADFTIAPLVALAALPEPGADAGPIHAFFRKHLHLGSGRDRTREWLKRCLAYDA